MNDNFLNWTIGAPVGWDVRCDAGSVGGAGLYWEWVAVEDGPQITASVRGRRIPLSFVRRSDARRARNVIARQGSTACWRLRLSADAEDAEIFCGRLEAVAGALPGRVDGDLIIVIADAAWDSKLTVQGSPQRLLAEHLGFAYDGGYRVVMETPLLLEHAVADTVIVYASNGMRIDARIDGAAGRQVLIAEKVSIPVARPEVRAGRLVALARAPEIVAARPLDRGADLAQLIPRPHELLEAWLRYEGVDRASDAELYEQRRAAPLEFRGMHAAEDGDWKLGVASGGVEAWLPDGKGLEKNLDAAVQIVSLTPGPGREAAQRATLRAFSQGANGELTATIRYADRAHRPPGDGRILPAEDQGAAISRQRRGAAIDRLRSGDVANPRLLELLLDPSRIPSTSAKVESFVRRHGDHLETAQAEAVAKGSKLPEIMLIQGPPGTGKTEVLAELVRVLGGRYGGRADESGGGAFRILIAGAQNEAVKNAYRRVGRDAVVTLIGKREDDEKNAEIVDTKGRQIAMRVRERLAQEPLWTELQEALQVRRLLADAEAALLEQSDVVERLSKVVGRMPPALVNQRVVDALPAVIESLRAATVVSSSAADDAASARPLPPEVIQAASLDDPADVAGAALLVVELERAHAALSNEPDPDTRVELLDTIDSVLSAARRAAERPAALQIVRERMNDLRASCAGAGAPERFAQPIENDGRQRAEREALEWIHVARKLLDVFVDARQEEGDGEILDDWLRTLTNDAFAYGDVEKKHASIAAATCQKAADSLRADGELFDVAIIDEAARAGLDVLIPMTLARHVILVGDHKQLPPHVKPDLWEQLDPRLQRSAEQGSSLFEWFRTRMPAENFVALDVQFRMHEDIGTLVSKAFYEPEVTLRHHFGGERARARVLSLGLFDNQPVVWVDTHDRRDRSVSPCREENEYECDLIFRLLENISAAELDALTNRANGKSIGVLAFYGAQLRLLSDRIKRLPLALREQIDVDTVARVQGREWPLVIVATTRSSANAGVGFLRDASSANVALSRAQSQLVIVGDALTLGAQPGGKPLSVPWTKVIALLKTGEVPGRWAMGAEVLR